MIIRDLFSHKIHSSSAEWQDKLVELACVFAEFDGLPYDRLEIETRLQSISPRAAFVSRDPSKFRDEISAYPAYLGLYHLEIEHGHWIFKLSETAKRFLVVEEPNVPAFMLLQLMLFQYPNGMGFAYKSNSAELRIQANVRDRTFQFIEKGIHLSPLRLICKALLADSQINGINPLHPRVSIEEIFILANDYRTNKNVSPNLDDITTVLIEARNGLLLAPDKYEKRFHILNHTDFLQVSNGWIHLREVVSPEDAESIKVKLRLITSIEIQFEGFDGATNENELSNVMFEGEWGKYFDGVSSLSSEAVQILSNDGVGIINPVEQENFFPYPESPIDYSNLKFNYPLKPREEYQPALSRFSRQHEFADPEVTKIKRQRSNLLHKILTQKMDEHLRNLGAIPYENEHIDLFASIPNDGSFLFEIKSINSDNLLSQTRKGLSQLYEYRYRYTNEVGNKVTLCLVYPKEPNEIEWLQKYLCNDREIAICWFNGDQLCFPTYCAEKLRNLVI